MPQVPQAVFHFEDNRPGFEDLGKSNGATHWDEDILKDALGYESELSFAKALRRAKQACLSLGIQCEDHFILQSNRKHAITRFGCYLVAEDLPIAEDIRAGEEEAQGNAQTARERWTRFDIAAGRALLPRDPDAELTRVVA
jgi:hypothetical protein